jgi:uncharacterized phage protein (TIGR02216 family)
MHIGLGELKLSSDHFWRLTPRELFAALAPPGASQGTPLRRVDLVRLMTAFPDNKDGMHGPAA